MILIENPFALFTDNNGELLESGYIYIGTAGLNPETNPINVFWDKDLLYPAAQPIRTINGLPSRNGTVSSLYTASLEYSVMTKDKNQVFIYSTSFYPTVVVPADGSVTGPKIDDTATFIFPTLLSLQKGADIAPVAGVLTLGIDGNYFDVTGIDPITSIASIGIGTQATLQFDAALVFTYHATNLINIGKANITTAAGDHAIMMEYDTGKWVMIDYIRATGSPLLGEFIDSDFSIVDNGDNTKKIAFQASGITTGNTRTLNMPDKDLTFDYGDYISTPTGVANISSVGSTDGPRFTRMGDVVHATMQIGSLQPTAGSTQTTLRVSLPIASNLAAGGDLTGSGAVIASGASAANSVWIGPDLGNNEAAINFFSLNTADHFLDVNFTYKIIA